MRAPRSLWPSILVFMLLLVSQTASSQIPSLWSKAHIAASQGFPIYSWRSVEEVVKGASKQEIRQFVDWTPRPAEIFGHDNDEETFLFIWARLDDRGKANIQDLESKRLPWPDTASPGLIKLRITQDHRLLLLFFRSIESDNYPDPFDFGVIRCLGLVPVEYIEETIAELRKYCHDANPVMEKYCDRSSKKPDATGIYGEEMIEIQDMLEYRKTGVFPAPPKDR